MTATTALWVLASWTHVRRNTFEHRFEGTERQLHEGDKWGGFFDCAWMHFSGVVPTHPPADDGGG
eukprot:COSAG01_NODE_28994_length_647_cov_25.793796_1_plen_64_part_10